MKNLFLLFLVLCNCCVFGQQDGKKFADACTIYKGFSSGGTTASLWFYSKAVDTARSARPVPLDPLSLDTLNFLTSHVASKKHFQQKVGPSYYASIVTGGQERRIAIVPGWAIIDLRNKRQYIFRNSPYAAIYQRFVEKNFKG